LTNSINEIPRAVRRRLKTISQKNSGPNYRRRANALLLLYDGYNVSQTAELMKASRTSVRLWRDRSIRLGEAGLVPGSRGRPVETVTDEVCVKLLELVQEKPSAYYYLRSRWSSEMLAKQLCKHLSMVIHSSTVRRLLPQLGINWNRARPTLHIKDPHKTRKMKAIKKALRKTDGSCPVFYVDEADVDLNPRIGSGWMKKGTQSAIPTPGKNKKNYLAGALNAATGNVIWVEWEKKNSEIFILLMAELRKHYRQAKKIILIADNYVIHKSAMTKCFLKHNPKFTILFQPVYHPWINKIELLWKQLHDNITRNHHHSTMNKLMASVRHFMKIVSPYPGQAVQLAKI